MTTNDAHQRYAVYVDAESTTDSHTDDDARCIAPDVHADAVSAVLDYVSEIYGPDASAYVVPLAPSAVVTVRTYAESHGAYVVDAVETGVIHTMSLDHDHRPVHEYRCPSTTPDERSAIQRRARYIADAYGPNAVAIVLGPPTTPAKVRPHDDAVSFTLTDDDDAEPIAITLMFGLRANDENGTPLPYADVMRLHERLASFASLPNERTLFGPVFGPGTWDPSDAHEPTLTLTALLTPTPDLLAHLATIGREYQQDYVGVVGIAPGRTLLNTRTGELE